MKLSQLIKAATDTLAAAGDIDVLTTDGWEVQGIKLGTVSEQESVEWDMGVGMTYARVWDAR